MNALILSYALDTNGQNARFVEAAKKHGTDERVIRAMVIGNDDPGGVVGRLQLAADKIGGLSIRSAHRASPYFNFPRDILWTKETEREVRQLAQEADVIHLNNSYVAANRFRLRKPMLLHHHGSLFRTDPDHMLQMARSRRMAQAVSTIDLLEPAPDVLHWLPTAYDVDALAAFGKKHRRKPDGMVRIVHAPTNRKLKATAAFLEAIKGIPKVELVLVEGKTHAECMAIKATADIVFDQIAFGYGCNAVEAWGMGIPVISGADEWTTARMRQDWGETPYYHATVDSLQDAITAMVGSADMRAEWAAKGLAHVRKYHDERPALAKLAELYALAIKTYTGPPRIPGKAVTFRSKTGRSVSLDDVKVTFVDGMAQVDDPLVLSRLRYFVKKRPAFGITEVADGG